MKPGRLSRASEAVASSLLEDMGFRVLEARRRLEVNGVEVGEVDLIAERDGALYAVEVKAGPLDVGGVRQAYVNALIAGARPLVVARGYADDSARELARRLGVEVVTLPDSIPVTPEELRETVRDAVEAALAGVLARLTSCPELGHEEERLLEAIAASETIKDAAEAVGATVEDVARGIARLRERGLIRERGPYRRVRIDAALTLLCNRLRGAPGPVPRP